MKIVKVLVNALVLFFFLGIIYAISSVSLDVLIALIEGEQVEKYHFKFFEYLIYFWILDGVFMYPYLIFYRIILTNFNYKIAEKIIAGLIIGFIIGVILVKYDVSFYTGKLRPFKIIVLYIIVNTLMVIIDHIFFTKRIKEQKDS